MRVKYRLIAGFALILVLAAVAFFAPRSTTGQTGALGNRVLERQLQIELGLVRPHKYEQRVSSGVMYAVLGATGELDRRARAAPAALNQAALAELASRPKTEGCQKVYTGGGAPRNIRVNQDCSLRRQAEEVIAVHPTNPRLIIAGQNDSRIGFNHCGYDWSDNGGRRWGDLIPPFWSYLLGDGRTTDACSDPTATWDAAGNAYIGGIIFSVLAAPNAVVVQKSNAGIDGQFYHTPDSTQPFQIFQTDPIGVVASDTSPDIFNDKELMVADSNPESPKANYVYMTWTRFNFDTGEGVGVHSPIYFSQSTDGGATWSPGIEISGANPDICTDFSGSADPNACDQDQGSHPITGPDGSVYVIFGNGNTPELGINQVLFVKCPGTMDCSDPASWTDPVKINDLIGTHPVAEAPNPEGCPLFRQCLPPNGYRVPEFTSMSLSVDAENRIYAAWSDFRNGGPPCDTFDFATAAPPCNNDVFYSVSTDGGASWAPEVNVTAPFSPTAQWQPWSDVQSDGSRLYVTFYDRQYGNCEFDGCNDITLARIDDPSSEAPAINYHRITTSSMPNLTLSTGDPTDNPVQAGFLGDYMWVDVDSTGRVHIVWADTRGRNGGVPTPEEDIYYAQVKP